jgi:DnaJ-class molecular chaperone
MCWKKHHPDPEPDDAPRPTGPRECETCSGTGCDPDDLTCLDLDAEDMRACPDCDGTGEVD